MPIVRRFLPGTASAELIYPPPISFMPRLALPSVCVCGVTLHLLHIVDWRLAWPRESAFFTALFLESTRARATSLIFDSAGV